MSAEACPPRDDAAAYVLGALPEGERQAYARHLARCARCEQGVADLRLAAEVLPSAVPPLKAPPRLKGRIMEAVRAEAALLEAAGPEPAQPAPSRARRWTLALRPLPATALATVLLVIGLAAGTLVGGGDSGATQRSVWAGVDRKAAPGARAELRVGEYRGTLIVSGLPAPPRGRIYQVWLKDAGRKAPRPTAALFSVNRHGRASVDVPGDLDGVDAVLVTHEPMGGSVAPTGLPPIITARTA